MIKMKKTTILLLSAGLLLSSCSVDLNNNYDCPCKEIAKKFKGVKYEDLEKAWGTPSFNDPDVDEKAVYIKWKKSGFFTDSDEIMFKFRMSTWDYSVLQPVGKPDEVYCLGKEYMSSGAGMQRPWDKVK